MTLLYLSTSLLTTSKGHQHLDLLNFCYQSDQHLEIPNPSRYLQGWCFASAMKWGDVSQGHPWGMCVLALHAQPSGPGKLLLALVPTSQLLHGWELQAGSYRQIHMPRQCYHCPLGSRSCSSPGVVAVSHQGRMGITEKLTWEITTLKSSFLV